MSAPLLILSVTGLINLSLLSLMFLMRSKDTDQRSIIFFSLSIVFLLLWSCANFFADTSSNSEQGLFWTRATFVPALLMCLFILFFSIRFPIEQTKRTLINVIYPILVVIASGITFTYYGVSGATVEKGVGITAVNLGDGYTFVILVILSLIIHATYNFYYKYRTLSGKYREQLRLVLIGWLVFLGFAFFTNALLPLITGDATWGKLGPLGSVVMVAFITYAIIRHALFDIKLIVQRSLVYSVLLTLSGGLYMGLLFLTERLFSQNIEVDVIISAFITASVGIIVAPTLKKYFEKITDPIFFRDAYNYAEVLANLADALNKNIIERTIIKKTSAILAAAIRPESIDFVFGSNRMAGAGDFEIVMPIKNGEKIICVLCLGKKRSGGVYSREDISLLTIFTSQAGVALEKARLYTQVKDYAKTLEEKVEKRTAEIVALHKEQESMMHEISHGLQTPLTIMKGQLYFLRKQGYEADKIDTIDGSINRISLFINKLLGLYRLETAEPVKFKSVELRGLLIRIADELSGLMTERGVTYNLEFKKPVRISGDAEGLEEVFSNLIHNAIKYSKPEGGTKISVSIKTNKDSVVIKISDTGIGIPKEEVGNLFTKFYRVRNSSTKHVSGTGLGLVIAKKIVERHRGEMAVESEFGSGTIFTVRLPKK